MTEEYIPVAAVAKLLNVSRTTVWNWIKTGKIPAIRIGRNYRIKAADVHLMIR